MRLRTRTVNPFGIHRRSFISAWWDTRRTRRLLHEPPPTGGRPRLSAGDAVAGAAVGELPLRRTHADAAMRWNVISIVESLREKTSGTKLARLDRKLARTLAKRPHALELAAVTGENYERARDARQKLREEAAGREDELERHQRARATLITACLIVFDASVMVQPWHLFSAPSIPGLSHYQNDASSVFAILRATLLSIAIVLTAKRAGTEVRLQVAEHPRARLAGSIAMLVAITVTTILLIRSTSEMQSAYLAILSGGSTPTLSANVFLMVMLFVISASLCTGFWLSNPLSERDGRLRAAERRTQREWSSRTNELDALDGELRALGSDRAHLLAGLRHLEFEQVALEQEAESAMHIENWLIYGLRSDEAITSTEAERTPGHESADEAAPKKAAVDDLAWIGGFDPEAIVSFEAPQPLAFPRTPKWAPAPGNPEPTRDEPQSSSAADVNGSSDEKQIDKTSFVGPSET